LRNVSHPLSNLSKTDFYFRRVFVVLLAALILIIDGFKAIHESTPHMTLSALWGLGFGAPSLVEVIKFWHQPTTVSGYSFLPGLNTKLH
jgi:hypothetical protein